MPINELYRDIAQWRWLDGMPLFFVTGEGGDAEWVGSWGYQLTWFYSDI